MPKKKAVPAPTRLVGVDPRKLSPAELRAAGIAERTPLQAIRQFYLDKHGGDPRRVLEDADTMCPLWAFRLGRNPWVRLDLTPERRAELAEQGRTLVAHRHRGTGGPTGAPMAPAPAH